MRKELKIIGSKERHVFTATFIRFGFRDGYKGPVKTILLQDVLLDGKVVTDHLWFDLTKGFKNADLLPGDVVEFCACDCDDNSLFSDRIKNSIEPELWISLDVITNYLPDIKQNHL